MYLVRKSGLVFIMCCAMVPGCAVGLRLPGEQGVHPCPRASDAGVPGVQ